MNAPPLEPRADSTPATSVSPAKAADAMQDRLAHLLAAEAMGPSPWISSLRQAGLERFRKTGFPTLQDEDWRFTNVEPIAALPFKPVDSVENVPVKKILGNVQLPFESIPALRLVFVDGHFVQPLSDTTLESGGARVHSLASEAARQQDAVLESLLSREAGHEDNPFTALNDAFFTGGAFIYVPERATVPHPIHLVHLATAREKGATAMPRHVIVAEPGSRLTVIESYLSLRETPAFTNAFTQLEIGDQATVEHIKLQDESLAAFHVAAIHATLGRGCRFWSHSIATGAKLSRNNIRTRLSGPGLECILNGLYLIKADQLADHHMIVDHASPHCASHEYFNGILAGRSRGVFHGRILVQQAAQKTDAKQTNKNLLLSDDATANAKPQLEIYADDVRCTHGATVGQLDEEAIFYLRARGLGLESARHMLIHAFAGEIIERIQHPALREHLDQRIWNLLEEHQQVSATKSGSTQAH